jgi:hypothetical protein
MDEESKAEPTDKSWTKLMADLLSRTSLRHTGAKSLITSGK